MLSVGSLNTTWLKAFKKSAEKRKATPSLTGVPRELEIPVRQAAQNTARRSTVFADLNRAEIR
jgi:hypothetical protein